MDTASNTASTTPTSSTVPAAVTSPTGRDGDQNVSGRVEPPGTRPEPDDTIGGDSTSTSSSEQDSDDRQSARPSSQRRSTMLNDEGRNEVRRVATALSAVDVNGGHHRRSKPGLGRLASRDDEPDMNPESPSFDLPKWLSRFMATMRGGRQSTHPGILLRDLTVSGSASDLQLQSTVLSVLATPLRLLGLDGGLGQRAAHRKILTSFNGVVREGEMLVVLGRPGSGCSTMLKTMCGESHGLRVDKGSTIHYGGVPQSKMIKEFRGEVIYNQEVDKHFPELTVGQTLEFAASVRMPRLRWTSAATGQVVTRRDAARYIARVVMAVCGLSHTYNTKVGNEFVRGVSGGERKRVSIAEMLVAGSPFMAWDNSTRGLDSTTALRFVQTLRTACDLAHVCNAVAIYQAGESIYELFDKATVLYEGRQIYFGPATAAKAFFEGQGWLCPARQTTGDFLTSVTNPIERRAQPGMEDKVPRTAAEFEAYWRASPEYRALQEEMAQYDTAFPADAHGPAVASLRATKERRQAKHVRPASPFIISTQMQVALNMRRAYQRIWNDPVPTLTTTLICIVLSLVIGSAVYGTPDATSGFYAKASALFMAVLLNALITISEINNLYAQRPIVEKHASYAFYHPATEAIAGIVADLPVKFAVACCFNVIIYFLAGLRREPSQFFIYFLFSFTATITMAAIFRSMAAMTRTVSQAMTLAGIIVLALVMYTGFVIPAATSLKPWFGWMRWLNPLYYAFEALMANEFHGRNFTCSVRVPAYSPSILDSWVCYSVGAVAGQDTVSGDAYIAASYSYHYSHVWRNYGIMIAFLISFLLLYSVATEINTVPSSAGEVLVYQRGHVPAHLLHKGGAAAASSAAAAVDEEKGPASAGDAGARPEDPTATGAPAEAEAGTVHGIPPQKDIFTWKDVVYDIPVKADKGDASDTGRTRRLLDHVSGWVQPGTLTALMGVSGAGKTTLLDVLAERTTMGVITGDMLVNGKPRGTNFQRSTGYVQQQDLHLETATVRESLRFSAMLRQPPTVSRAEKYAFVEEVIAMLNMFDFADAVVGVPGEGLNVEQRKLLTIGVELAAKPKLLLFLDEPTSGLDSQSAWAICTFLRKLADAGQAVLCTIHQPSAVLFEQFDRLLFLAAGGKTVYFGPIGADSRTLLDYFSARGARVCGDAENPAEYMLEIVNGTRASDGRTWHETWMDSPECVAVGAEVARLCAAKQGEASAADTEVEGAAAAKAAAGEFAMPFTAQLALVTQRIFQQYWRMPMYVFSKLMLATVASLFIGFSFFQANSSLAGTQAVIFSSFQMVTIFTSLVQQIQPLFVTQRSLYEVRERPGKMYSWKAFLVANIVVEFPYQILCAVLAFACFYFPVMGVQASQRQGLVLLLLIELFLYASSFAHMCIAALPDAQTAGGVVTLLVMTSLIFSGVLQTPTALPGFWIFMYRVSPFTYWIAGVLGTELHGRAIECSAAETSVFDPPPGYSCGQYLAPYLALAPGTLQNPDATSACRYCYISVADTYLGQSDIYWGDRWRNFGILWGYICFNIFIAVLTYYLFRVRRWNAASLAFWKNWKKGKGKP